MKHITADRYNSLVEAYRDHLDEFTDVETMRDIVHKECGHKFTLSKFRRLWQHPRGGRVITQILIEVHYKNIPCILHGNLSEVLLGTSYRRRELKCKLMQVCSEVFSKSAA